MRLLRLLGLRRLRHDPRRVLLAVVTVAAGVTLAVTSIVVTESIERSARAFGQEIGGAATLRVEGAVERGGLTPERLRAIEDTPGVRAAVPLVRALTFVDPPSPGGEPVRAVALGVDCRVELLLGEAGCSPRLLEALGDGPMGMGPQLATAGSPASVRTETGPIPLGEPAVFDVLEEVAGGRAVLFALETAQALFLREDRYDVAYVVTDQGVDTAAVRAALEASLAGQHPVLPADDPPAGLELFLSTFMPLFGVLSVFGVIVGGVLVRNIVTLALAERRGQLALLLSLGSRRATLAGITLAEIALLGLAGGVVGTAAGVALAVPVTAALSPLVEDMLGISLATHVPPAAVAAGLGIGIVAAVVAGASAVREVVRVDPAAALAEGEPASASEQHRSRSRAVVWVLLAAAGAGASWAVSAGGGLETWQVRLGPPAFLAVTAGVMLAIGSAGPAGARELAGWFRRRTPSAATVLALGELRADRRRTGVMMGAVAAAVLLAVVADGMARSVRAAVQAGDTAPPGVYVFLGDVADPDVETSAMLGPGVVADLRELPEAGRVVGTVLVLAGRPGEEIAVQASDDPRLGERLLRGAADLERLAAGQALVGPGIARRLGVEPGDDLALPTPWGPVTVPVQGVWEDGRYGGMNVTLPLWLVEQLYGPQPPVTVTVQPRAGVGEAELADAVRGAGIDPRLQALTRQEYLEARAGQIVEQVAPVRLLQYALTALAFVAVATTMLLAARQRRRQHATLVALGSRSGDLARSFLYQAAVMAGVAIVLAAAGGLLVQWSLQQVMPLVVGFRQPFRPEPAAAAISGAVLLAVTLAAALWPARQATRIGVVEALRAE